MRIIVLLLAVAITGYLVTRQLKEATPVAVEGASDNKTENAMPYSKQMDKARALEKTMQEDVDRRLKEMDALAK